MKDYKLSFAVNLNDNEGDSYEDCIMVFLGNGVILQFEDMGKYTKFIKDMQGMIPEIAENL
jgi:hypothetical protein